MRHELIAREGTAIDDCSRPPDCLEAYFGIHDLEYHKVIVIIEAGGSEAVAWTKVSASYFSAAPLTKYVTPCCGFVRS